MTDPEKTPAWQLPVLIGISVISIAACIAGLEARSRAEYAEDAYERLRERNHALERDLELRHQSARECCRETQGAYTQCIAAFKLVTP